MYKISIRNQEGQETNAAYFNTQLECESWRDKNHPYFPDGYSSNISSQSESNFMTDELRGELNQYVGRKVLAKIHAINCERIRLGLLTQQQLSSLLDDDTIKKVERFLLNGYLSGAIALITNMSDSHFNSEHKTLILDYIESQVS